MPDSKKASIPFFTRKLKPQGMCPICRHSLPVGARYCIECKHDLTWRRHLGISNTALALLTALIAVAASSIDAIKKLFEPNDSAFHAQLIGTSSRDENVSLLVSNNGKRTGAVIGGAVYVSRSVANSPNLEAQIHLEYRDPHRMPVLIKPGTADEVRFKIWFAVAKLGGVDVKELPLQEMSAIMQDQRTECSFRASVINPVAGDESVRGEVDCRSSLIWALPVSVDGYLKKRP